MAGQNALEIIFERNAFYRRQYLLALSAFAMMLIVIAILVFIIVYIIRNPTAPIYFAADNVGRLIRIIPVEQRNMNNDELFAWTIEAVQNARSYDFINYRSQLQNAQKYFTTYGWRTYKAGYDLANNLPAVLTDKKIVLAKVVGQPRILKEGPLDGAYAWQLEFPLLVSTYSPPYGENDKSSNALIDTIIIRREPILQSYKGLGIVQLIERQASLQNQPQEISGTQSSG